ncbi:hypothetical protein B0H10DRAFT_1846350 [Mycena sp. CBHHK59/15]|nr:hypothetical protein B0H10DRAFT_1846350 [Mycena sp. CBHHK59/15]
MLSTTVRDFSCFGVSFPLNLAFRRSWPLLSARSSLVTDKIHRLADNCSGLRSFFVFHSFGGRTSSGFSALLLKRLSTDYGNVHILTRTVSVDHEVIYDTCKRTSTLSRPASPSPPMRCSCLPRRSTIVMLLITICDPWFLILLLHFLCNLVLLSPALKVLDCGALTSIRSDLGWRMSFPFRFSRQLELKYALLNCPGQLDGGVHGGVRSMLYNLVLLTD